MTDKPDDEQPDDTTLDEQPNVLNTLSDTARRFLGESDDLEAATDADLPDDASGEEVPQDGDPGR